MNQPNDLELAKQGDATAIAALINRHLKPKGIAVVESTLKNGCLQVILESEQALDQQVFVAWIRKLITSLNPESIDRVRVYCRQAGVDFMSWTEQFALKTISTHQSLEQDQEETLHKDYVRTKKQINNISKQVQKDMFIVVTGTLIFVVGIWKICNPDRNGSPPSCYDLAAQRIINREGDKPMTQNDFERKTSEIINSCR